MQSLRLLIATAVLAIAAANPRPPVWDPTTRDKTEVCTEFTLYAPADKKCELFNKCCVFDPLNGDKCKNIDKTCEPIDGEQFNFSCKYSNCSEMITTTTTTTTQSPRQVNGATGVSLFCLVSAILPRFF